LRVIEDICRKLGLSIAIDGRPKKKDKGNLENHASNIYSPLVGRKLERYNRTGQQNRLTNRSAFMVICSPSMRIPGAGREN
jgi:hypothetical protein